MNNALGTTLVSGLNEEYIVGQLRGIQLSLIGEPSTILATWQSIGMRKGISTWR
jgi:hypothetical protein